MKKIISVALATLLVLSAVFTVPMVFADDTANDSITNTFDEGWTPNDANLSLVTSEENNGNALKLNKATSSTATPTGNSVRHYKIYDPEKVSGEFVDYKPTANTTYKITFRYYTTSLAGNSIFVNVRGVENDTVGDILTRAVTVKKWLKLYEADGTTKLYVWEDAVAYFTTPETDLDALAISVEWNGANDSTGVNVTIDNVKLEKFSENYVLFNAFEEDNVTETTLNIGTNTLNYKNSSYNTFTTGYNTNSAGSTNANTLRANSTLGFRAARYAGDSANEIVRYEIYDYSKGLGTDGKLQSFIPEKGSTYKVSFQYKVKASGSTNLLFNIRPVTVDGEGNRTLGEAIANLVTVPKSDANHSTAKWHSPDAVEFTITDDFDGLALTVETASGTPTTYTFIDNVLLTEVKDECEHANKTTNTVESSYFVKGSETVTCDDCGETVSTNELPCNTADPVTFDKAVLNPETNKLTVTWTYSKALNKDIEAAANKALTVKFAFGEKVYTVPNTILTKDGGSIVIEGVNADRFNTTLKVNLEFAIGEYTTTALNEVAEYSVAVSTTVDSENAKADAYTKLIEEIGKVDEAVVAGVGTDNDDFTAGASKIDIKAGTAEIKFVATETLIDTLLKNGNKDKRTVKLVVTIGEESHDVTLNELRSNITVKISGLSFDQMYGSISANLVIDYAEETNISDIETKAVTFDFVDGVNNSDLAAAAALEALLKK